MCTAVMCVRTCVCVVIVGFFGGGDRDMCCVKSLSTLIESTLIDPFGARRALHVLSPQIIENGYNEKGHAVFVVTCYFLLSSSAGTTTAL